MNKITLIPEKFDQVSDEAWRYLQQSSPRSPHFHVWKDDEHTRLLLANGSQLFDVAEKTASQLIAACHTGNERHHLSQLGLNTDPIIDGHGVPAIPLHALSLAVAQKCNLGCSYCYASEGDFGAPPQHMSLETALQSVDQLLKQTPAQGRFNIAFMGGEPLVNREVIRATTEYAAQRARESGLTPLFSITTNGTLLTGEDADFFEHHGFAVTISLDGKKEQHNQLRPFKGGRGSFERILRNVQPMLALQRRMQVSARVTVTPENLGLTEMLDYFLNMGFHSVGFSPMLHAPNGKHEMQEDSLQIFLSEMIKCGQVFERQALEGKRYGFANLLNALREINKGTHRPYPCGAGAGYLGVSAEGQLYACHRFVNDEQAWLGNLSDGVDPERQHHWLESRHVHQQSPCTRCWARYLCGGGCHHEVMGRGRTSCNYVRSWLLYCMDVHARLLRHSSAELSQCLAG